MEKGNSEQVKLEQLTFRRYQAEDVDQYIEFFQIVYGKVLDANFFHWKHRQGIQSPEAPLIFLVLNPKGQIIGANSFFPETLVYTEPKESTSNLRAVQSGDTMVHPDYRGRGIFMKLLAYSVQELRKDGYAGIFGFANGNSYPGFKKFGFADLGRIPVYYKMFSWAQFLRSKGKFTSYLGHLLDFGSAGLKFLHPSKVDKLYSVTRVQLTDEHIQSFLERENRSPLHPLKTKEYLQWKYEEKPNGSYQTWAISKNGECVAVFVVRVERYGEGLAGEIVEGVACPQDAAPALHSLLQRLQEGFQFIRIWESNDEFLMNGIRKNHFFKREAELYFVYYTLQEGLNFMAQRQLWEVISGNADTV